MRAFLFDIGNVLVRLEFSRGLRAVAALSDAADEGDVLALINAIKLPYEDGQMSRADFLAQSMDVLKFRGTEAQLIAAWQDIFSVNEPMYALVDQLRAKYPLFLLSNTNDLHVDALFRDFPVFAHFTGATYSHVARASKPHREIYEIACRDHGLTPAETFFIDDLPENIAAAQSLGFHTHQYRLDHHADLLTALRDGGWEY